MNRRGGPGLFAATSPALQRDRGRASARLQARVADHAVGAPPVLESIFRTVLRVHGVAYTVLRIRADAPMLLLSHAVPDRRLSQGPCRVQGPCREASG
jgi:hypothetical protein